MRTSKKLQLGLLFCAFTLASCSANGSPTNDQSGSSSNQDVSTTEPIEAIPAREPALSDCIGSQCLEQFVSRVRGKMSVNNSNAFSDQNLIDLGFSYCNWMAVDVREFVNDLERKMRDARVELRPIMQHIAVSGAYYLCDDYFYELLDIIRTEW